MFGGRYDVRSHPQASGDGRTRAMEAKIADVTTGRTLSNISCAQSLFRMGLFFRFRTVIGCRDNSPGVADPCCLYGRCRLTPVG